jgi:secondary thiamine-phosphate synthase enzyme
VTARASANPVARREQRRDAGTVRIRHTGLAVESRSRIEWRDLTAPVRDAVRALGISDGVALVSVQHTTCALFLSEYGEPLMRGLLALLERLVPERGGYRHDDPRVSDCERGNGSAHLRAALLGRSVALGVANGELALGPCQSIILAELDGPRAREISIQLIGGSGGRGLA